ncbi:hypothetical protein GA0115250_127310 [Streptomyces sp. BvitLS-983]|nr:hypothetical protein GA0115236_107710 [Streptomyces sp. IgraMP-1]SCD87205.1 hypothetical protein GA0115250_127310 [Streptomyces sp. BvitLS-983]
MTARPLRSGARVPASRRPAAQPSPSPTAAPAVRPRGAAR